MLAIASNGCQRRAHFTFVWTIENASALLVSTKVKSPIFIAQSICMTNWMLKVHSSFFYGFTNLVIQRKEDNGPKNIYVEIELSIRAANGSPLWVKTCKQEFTCTDDYRLRLFKNRNEGFVNRRAEFLPNDALTVRCRMWRVAVEILEFETRFAHTRLGLDRRYFIWTIKKFSRLQPEQKRTYILNPVSSGTSPITLSLSLSRNDDVGIQILYTATKDYFFICKFSLLDCEGKIVHTREMKGTIDVNSQVFSGFENFLVKSGLVYDAASLLPNDTLSLRCEIQFEADPLYISDGTEGYSDCEQLGPEIRQSHLQSRDESCTDLCPFKKTFADLYGDDSLSDVSLQAGAKLFPAHKNILGARSPVFKAMFTHDMREKISRVIDISDLNPDTLNRLLLYIYKNTVGELQWKSAIDLFKAADKYQVLDLRKTCSVFLKSNLSVASVCDILSLAIMHENSDLREAAENFISEHDNEVFGSKEWKIFKAENFHFALEIMERVIHLIKRKFS